MAKAYMSPDGAAITGTLEHLKGRSHLTEIEDDGTPVHSGGTEVFWDEQVTCTDAENNIIFLDDEGNQWAFKDLVPVSEENQNEE